MRKMLWMLVMVTVLGGLVATVHAKEKVPLPADRAFVFSATLNEEHEVVLQWEIAPGYYLYRDRMTLTPTQGKALLPEVIVLPEGKAHSDAVRGAYQVFSGSVQVPLALRGVPRGILRLDIDYQGCSANGFCYTPIRKTLTVDLSEVSAPALLDPYVQGEEEDNDSPPGGIARLFAGNSWLVGPGFVGLGLLLAFTPCVLPMVPILSAIIVGQRRKEEHHERSRAFLLSLAYVAGMVVVYAMAGMAIALIGRNVQTALQRPVVLVVFSVVFVLLALALFGVYRLQLPRGLQRALGRLTGYQRGGRFAGVFLMGCLSTLIVSPCVSAPLVGVLTFIGQTGNVWLGLLALASLGFGMGIPLLLLGASAGKLLPRTGPWMTGLERFFGVFMLMMAAWMLSRAIPGPALTGQPASPSLFTRVQSPAELNEALRNAHQAGRPVLLDFYADWCAPCVLMDRTLFSRADVQTAMQSFVRLRVDLTANHASDRQLLRRFRQVGPPAMVFFDCAGRLRTAFSLTGDTAPSTLITQLQHTRQTLACKIQQKKNYPG